MIRGPIRFRTGKQIKGKSTTKNTYMIIEFENEQAVDSGITRQINQGKVGVLGLGTKAYKAGTNTFVQIRKSKRA